MTKDILDARIKELSQAIIESADNFQKLKSQLDNIANNHNTLVGRLEEANEMYKKFEKSESNSPVTIDVSPVSD